MKNKSGITLVALVITIIILLILAGVAITTLTQTSLFENAKQAKKSMEDSQKKENVTIANYENKINEVVTSTRDNNLTIMSLINKEDEVYNKIEDGYVFSTPLFNENNYITSNNDIILKDSIENYDYIMFEFDTYYTGENDYTNSTTQTISTQAIKKTYVKNFGWNYGKLYQIVNDWIDIQNRITIGFKNSTNIYVWHSCSNNAQLTKLRITDIKGIKY